VCLAFRCLPVQLAIIFEHFATFSQYPIAILLNVVFHLLVSHESTCLLQVTREFSPTQLPPLFLIIQKDSPVTMLLISLYSPN